MKRVLVTGNNGYISKNIVSKFNLENIKCESKSVREKEYNKIDFKNYSTVIHAAAVVHKKGSEREYIDINNKLTIKIAEDCKQNGVNHFVFLSTMSVFGKSRGAIHNGTPLKPTTLYGKSKLAAEKKLMDLEDQNFRISIIRPPMVYGKNSPGNYKNLSKISKYLWIVPSIKNKRSMIFIDNLSQFILDICKKNKFGIFHPQNDEYICTSDLIIKIRSVNNQRTIKTNLFNPLLNKLLKNNSYLEKIFGDLYYKKEEFETNFSNKNISFDDSIKFSEKESQNYEKK